MTVSEKMREDERENRGKQILIGAAILSTISVVVVGFLMGWRFVPGWVGESLGTVAGVLTTPFLMETSFFLLGLTIVIGLNARRRRRTGDEFVTIEVSEDVEAKDAAPRGKG